MKLESTWNLMGISNVVSLNHNSTVYELSHGSTFPGNVLKL